MDVFINLCRCCYSEKQNILNIFQSKTFNNTTSVVDMLQYCLQVTIPNDSKYPEFICYDCVKQLEISYKFIKRFQLAKLKFEEAYKHIQESKVEANKIDIDKAVGDTTHQKENINTFLTYSDNLHKNTEIIEDIEIESDVGLSLREEEITNQVDNKCVSKNLSVLYVGSHTDTTPDISCYICQKTFFTRKALNLHIKLLHKNKV